MFVQNEQHSQRILNLIFETKVSQPRQGSKAVLIFVNIWKL